MTENAISLLERVVYTLEGVRLPATGWGLDAMQKLVGCAEAVRQVLQECENVREAIRQAEQAADATDETAAATREAEHGR